MAEQGGTFRRKRTNFSQVSNVALTNPKLSLRAKGLYAVIQRYLTLAEFSEYKVYKSTIQANCCEGRAAFNAAWNELKDAGFLKVHKQTTPKGYIYEYELLDEPDLDTASEKSKEDPRGRISTPWESDTWNPVAGNSTDWDSTSLNKKEEKNKEVNNKHLTKKDILISHSNETVNKLLNIDEVYDSEFEGHRDAEFELRAYLSTILNSLDIERMKQDIKNLIECGFNQTPYTYNDFLLFAIDQVSLPSTYWFADSNPEAHPKRTYKAALEWVKAMASIYSNENETLYVGKTQVKTINFKQRLLQIDYEIFERILVKFSQVKENSNISNPSGYMMQMLYNGVFDSGVNSYR